MEKDRGSFASDCLSDLRTQKNALSIYRIPEPKGISFKSLDETQLNQADFDSSLGGLLRVITALASTRDSSGHYDFGLVPSHSIRFLSKTQCCGDTKDSYANNVHFDLVALTGSSLVRLGNALLRNGRFFRLREKRLKVIAGTAAERKYISEAPLWAS